MDKQNDIQTNNNQDLQQVSAAATYLEHYTEGVIKTADDLNIASEKLYNDISQKIIETSKAQLKEQNDYKNGLRKNLNLFFTIFLSIQYLVLVVFLIIQGCGVFNLSPEIIITYITAVFVETLGGIIFMVKFAFESSQENRILEIMNNFLKDFKKHSDNKKQ